MIEPAAYFEYKCRRCGRTISDRDCSEELARQLLIRAAVCRQRSTQLDELPLFGVHACNDGGFGLSELVGFSVEK